MISDELVERTRTQQREAEAALRAKRDAQAHGDADGELARLAQALADLGRRASELRQVHALWPVRVSVRPMPADNTCSFQGTVSRKKEERTLGVGCRRPAQRQACGST